MSYEEFVMRAVRQVRVARSLDEAFRTPTYGCAIWRFEENKSRYWKQFAPAIVIAAALAVILIYPDAFTQLTERFT